jgi:PAS domain-containing protein
MHELVQGLSDPALVTYFQNGLFIVQGWNEPLERLMHRGAEDAIGRPADVVLPPWIPRLRRRNERQLRRQGFMQTVVHLRTARGRRLDLFATGAATAAIGTDIAKCYVTTLQPWNSPQIAAQRSHIVGTVPDLGNCEGPPAVGVSPAVGTVTESLDLIIGANLKRARQNRRPPITQRQLAEHLQVAANHMSEYENGRRSLNRVRLIQAAELLGVTLDWLHTPHPCDSEI